MIIITGTFRNTSNPLKIYETTIFITGSFAHYSVYKSTVIIMLMKHELQMHAMGSILIKETGNFQILFPTPYRL